MKMRSTSTFPAVLSIVLFIANYAVAQEHPAVTAQANTVYVGGDGKYEAAPDTAVIQFDLSVEESKADAAYEHASRDAEQVREILRANGVDPKAASLGFFSTQPVYDWKTPTRKQVAVRVTTDVTLKLKDFSKIGSITEQLTDAKISESLSLTYTLDNMDEAKSKAVEDAYRRARASADTLAHASGRALGELSYASVDTFEHPRPLPRMSRPTAMRAEAAPAPTEEFTPQNVTVTAHVNALFNLK
jgi:uncharacterized protein YggE